MRVRQHLVHHAVPGDGRERRCSVRAQNDQIGCLGPSLVQHLLGRVAWYHDRLNINLLLQLLGDQRNQIALDLVNRTARQNLAALLRLDHVLQDEPGVVMERQGGGE